LRSTYLRLSFSTISWYKVTVRDDAVPSQTSLALGEQLESRNVVVILCKYGEHRLSSESELARLDRTLDEPV
jgi:hypothetical protein